MAENSLENNEKIGEKTDFSDTGSQILVENQAFSQENGAQKLNHPNKTEKSSDFLTNTEENTEKNKGSQDLSSDFADFFNEESENDLKTAYPAVDIKDLRNNKDFCSLLSMIMKNPSLAQVYSCFNSIIANAEDKSRQKALQAMANAKASVGSLASSKENGTVFFTKEQVLQMSPDQIRKNYSEIRKSQQSW